MSDASILRAATRLGGIALLAASLAPTQSLYVRHAPRRADRLARWFHRRVLATLGIELRVVGEPCAARPTLFVSNHVSYLDVNVIGAVLETCFVAKREVARWPGIGALARLQRTVFVARRRGQVAAQVEAMRARIAGGDNLVLFAEGTSTAGLGVLDFKPALLAAAEPMPGGPSPAIQPLWVAYRALDGDMLDALARDEVAWYGDMTLAPHLLRLAGRRRLAVEIGFGDPVRWVDFADRKMLAAHCRDQVAQGLAASLATPPWWQGAGDPRWRGARLDTPGSGVILVK